VSTPGGGKGKEKGGGEGKKRKVFCHRSQSTRRPIVGEKKNYELYASTLLGMTEDGGGERGGGGKKEPIISVFFFLSAFEREGRGR